MKKISILVPCFNEEKNIELMAEKLLEIMGKYEGIYDYEIVFRDNGSTDNSLEVMKRVAQTDKRVKIIVNSRNYGVMPGRDTFASRIKGDAVIYISGDFQDPPELIPEFLRYWEKGYEAVCGQKTSSQEGKIKFALRQLFYRIIDKFAEIPQYKNVSGMYLLSRRMFNYYSEGEMDLRFFLADVGCDVKLIKYEQQKRHSGKSSYNVWRSLTFAIYSLISVSTSPLRMSMLLGFAMSILSFMVGLCYLVYKLIWWNGFIAGAAPVLIGVFFLGSVQLFFIGIVGEYVGNILHKVTHKNPTFVRELINFDNTDDDPYLIKNLDDD